MYQDFEKMPNKSRIWIYQTNRILTEKEENITAYYLKEAVEQWAAHGAALLASVKIIHQRFVIIALDENQNLASGCSIDSSTHWMKDLGGKLNIDFFDRSIVYKEGMDFKSFPIFKAKSSIANGLINESTIIFNNNIQFLNEFHSKWEIPAFEFPFLNKHFVKTEV